MANKPKGYGMSAEITKKIASSFDPQLATSVCEWIISALKYGGKDDIAQNVPAKVRGWSYMTQQ